MNLGSSEFKIDDDKVADFVNKALNNNNQLCSMCATINFLNVRLKQNNYTSYYDCFKSLKYNNNNKQILLTLVPTYLDYAKIDNNPYRDEKNYKLIFNAICKKYIESVKPKLDSSKFNSNYDTPVIASTPYSQGIRAGGRKRSRRDRKSKKSRSRSRSRRSRRRRKY